MLNGQIEWNSLGENDGLLVDVLVEEIIIGISVGVSELIETAFMGTSVGVKKVREREEMPSGEIDGISVLVSFEGEVVVI